MMIRNVCAGIGCWCIINAFLIVFLVVERWLQDRARARQFSEFEQDFVS